MSLGIRKRDDRPLGVAVRTYFTSPRHDDDWMEGWLELPGRDGKLLPGYGWVFGVGDGTSNVGLGILNSSKEFGKLDYKQVLREWTAGMPAEWGFTPENQVGEIRGAALPMGFNRTPHYSPGLLLLGDAGGMVSPFNGEGISYAMESARFAAEFIIDGAARSASGGLDRGRRRSRTLSRYADYVRDQWGSHFTLGRAFAALIGKPAVMKLALRTGMPIPVADAVRGAAAGQPDRSRGQGLRGPSHPGAGIAGPRDVQPGTAPTPSQPGQPPTQAPPTRSRPPGSPTADGSSQSGANSEVSATKVRVNP